MNARALLRMLPVAMAAAAGYAFEHYAQLGGPVLYAAGTKAKLIVTAILSFLILRDWYSTTSWVLLCTVTFSCAALSLLSKVFTPGAEVVTRSHAWQQYEKAVFAGHPEHPVEGRIGSNNYKISRENNLI